MSKIQLYSMATPNGQKVSIALEELEVAYDAHLINIMQGDQFGEDFIKINPNSKIPAMIDPDGPNGGPINMMESGSILLYLANKYGKLIPKDAHKKQECINWLFFQIASVGPMFGQFGHFFKYAKDKCTDPYPLQRYSTEVKRLLRVIDTHLEGREFMIAGEYTIADIAIFPWVNCLDVFYNAKDFLELENYLNVKRWLNNCLSRPAVIKGMKVCSTN